MNHFFGSGLERTHYEIAMLFVDGKFRTKEADVMHRKWFDYQRMHPTEATYCWAHAYNEQSRIFFARCKDTETASKVVGIAPVDAMRSREVNAIWRSRFVCDRIGCPYPWALQFLMERAIRLGFRNMPRPNQLYGMDSVIDLFNAWAERVRTQLTYSSDPFMKAIQWEEHPAQVRHLEFVRDQIAKRASPRDRIVARLFKEGVLDQRLAQRFFPDEAEPAERYYRTVMLS